MQSQTSTDPVEIMVAMMDDDLEAKATFAEGLGNLLIYTEICDREFDGVLTPQTSRFVATFIKAYEDDVCHRYDEVKSRIANVHAGVFCTLIKSTMIK